MELLEHKTWQFIANNERNHTYQSIFHDYKNYIEDFEIGANADVIGEKYFYFNVCIDEIMEMFNEMILSGYSSLMTNYSFIIFLFKKQLFNKKINEYEAKNIFNKYIGKVIPVSNRWAMNKFDITESEFVLKLSNYNKKNTDEENNFVYDTFLEFIKELKYSW